jgi:hypothetical protein
MNKIVPFLKKYWWAVIIFIVSVSYVGFGYLRTPGQTPVATSSTSPVSQIATFGSIRPGYNTENDLSKILGTPLSQSSSSGQLNLNYKSTSINSDRQDSAVVQNGKVIFVKEIVPSTDKRDASSITSIYGTASDILYSKLPDSSFNLYVYPANGIAYLGHPDGTLQEIWYFQPTTIQNFLVTWGRDYTSIQPTPSEGVY